jgi:hypothetical protein
LWREEVYTGFWWKTLRERDRLEYPSVVGRIIIREIYRKWNGGTWIGLIWLRIGNIVGHL